MKLLVVALVGAWVALCSACVVHEVRATPGELEAARALLRAGRPARVRATAGDAATVAVVAPDQRVTVALAHGEQLELPLSAIMRECGAHPPEDGRLCEFHGVDHVKLGKRRHVHEAVWAGPIAFVIVGGTIGGIAWMAHCSSECTGWGKPTSQVGLVTLGLGFLYIVSQRGLR
ncbi:MAG: hypothetical protein KIT31_00130 [Deltaproteobacteria bacterium]|nr:hypothetical protein [Deltaproteobacteria bacterium]